MGEDPVAEEGAVLVHEEVLAPVDVHQHRDNVGQSAVRAHIGTEGEKNKFIDNLRTPFGWIRILAMKKL